MNILDNFKKLIFVGTSYKNCFKQIITFIWEILENEFKEEFDKNEGISFRVEKVDNKKLEYEMILFLETSFSYNKEMENFCRRCKDKDNYENWDNPAKPCEKCKLLQFEIGIQKKLNKRKYVQIKKLNKG